MYTYEIILISESNMLRYILPKLSVLMGLKIPLQIFFKFSYLKNYVENCQIVCHSGFESSLSVGGGGRGKRKEQYF